MSDILAELAQKMNDWITEYISSYMENNFSFLLTLIDGSYIFIQWNNYNSGTLKLKLTGNFSNNNFPFVSDYENINQYGYVSLDHNAPNCYLYSMAIVNGSDVNVYTPLPNYDRNSLYFHWSISNDLNIYVCEVNRIGDSTEHKYMREYELNNMKTFKINTFEYGYINEEEEAMIEEGTTKINFWFTNDGVTKLHILLDEILIEYVMYI
jgi:hypothetical protein